MIQDFSRRSLLAGMGTVGLAGLMDGTAALAASARQSFFRRVNLPIGLQVYTLGEEAGRDLDATFAQVAAIGYSEIELPNLFGREPAVVAASAKRAGLTIGSVHLPMVAVGGMEGLSLGSEPARIADALGVLGAKWAVAPLLMVPSGFHGPAPGEDFPTAIGRSVAAAGEDIWKQTAAQLNAKAALLKPLGIGVAYHNHNLEFAPIGKTSGWDILWRETDPQLVFFEVDVGWVATAGLDPVHFLDRSRGRVRLLHVKDVAAGNPQSFKIGMKPAEVGSGTLPWARILPAAYRAGARHFYVEQEPPFAIPRIEAARKSYAYLSQLRA